MPGVVPCCLFMLLSVSVEVSRLLPPTSLYKADVYDMSFRLAWSRLAVTEDLRPCAAVP